MTNNEIREAARQLGIIEGAINNLQEEANEIKANLKTELLARETETLDLGDMVIRNTEVTSQRLNTADLRKIMPEIYQMFLRSVISHKFTITA